MAALKSASASDPPHPDTASWAARGPHLPGRSIGDQLDALRRHPDSWQPDEKVVTGGEAVHEAAARLSRASTRRTRLAEATRFLSTGMSLALDLFTPRGEDR